MADYTENSKSRAVLALMKAADNVRKRNWYEGAPSHIFAELLAELEKDGWKIVRINYPKIPYSTSGNIDESEAYEP